jgi:hypoxanthine phosphoribosyltransferase
MKARVGSVLISRSDIERRIAEMGLQISRDYQGGAITIIGILKGSFIFLADLVRAIDREIPVEVDFMEVSSYGDGTMS